MIAVEVDHPMTEEDSVHVPRADPSGVSVTIVETSGGSGDPERPPMFTTARLSVAGPDDAVHAWLTANGHDPAQAAVMHRWDLPAPAEVPLHPLAAPIE